MQTPETSPPCLAQLQFLSGQPRRHYIWPDEFPVRLGRGGDCALRIEEEGVWEHHVTIELDDENRFQLKRISDASVMVNDEPMTDDQPLVNGDVLGLGSVKLQFWLGTVQQQRLSTREAAVWALLAAVTAVQVCLLLWLW